MREQFVDKNFGPERLATIGQVNTILDEYERQGYIITLRQLYYRMVARALIDNNLRSYKNLGNLVNEGRLAGLIDWDMIVDKNRTTSSPPHWDDPAHIVNAAANGFAIDKWADQDCHVEVMIEKDALSSVLLPVCRRLDVNFTANKGYPSASLLYEMSKRLLEKIDQDKLIYILHLGDHDPSGIDMTRDLVDRLSMFAGFEKEYIEVKRLALNIDQINNLRPPENPAKTTDSRYKAYLMEFGTKSWELDSIDPPDLDEIVTTAIVNLRDDDLWDAAVEREAEMRADLRKFARTYKRGD